MLVSLVSVSVVLECVVPAIVVSVSVVSIGE